MRRIARASFSVLTSSALRSLPNFGSQRHSHTIVRAVMSLLTDLLRNGLQSAYKTTASSKATPRSSKLVSAGSFSRSSSITSTKKTLGAYRLSEVRLKSVMGHFCDQPKFYQTAGFHGILTLFPPFLPSRSVPTSLVHTFALLLALPRPARFSKCLRSKLEFCPRNHLT